MGRLGSRKWAGAVLVQRVAERFGGGARRVQGTAMGAAEASEGHNGFLM